MDCRRTLSQTLTCRFLIASILLITNTSIFSCPLNVTYSVVGSDCDIVGNHTEMAVHIKDGKSPYKVTIYYTPTDSSVYNDTVITLNINPKGYVIRVSDGNNCFVWDTLVVPNAIEVSAEVVTLPSCDTCANGSAKVTVSGYGEVPFTYRWSDLNDQTTSTAIGLKPGTYSVFVTDNNGCFNKDTVVLMACDLEAKVTLEYLEDCDIIGNTQAHMYADVTGGTPPYDYDWGSHIFSDEDTILYQSAGNYQLKVTDSVGCIDIVDITIEQAIQLEIIVKKPLSCPTCSDAELEVLVSGFGSPPYFYRWNDPNDQTTAVATGLDADTYTVIVTDNVGCWNGDTMTVDNTIGFEDYQQGMEISLYPNPVFQTLSVHLANENVEMYHYSVSNISGKKIMSGRSKSNQFSIDVSHLKPGIYLFDIYTSIGTSEIKKFSVVR